MKASGPKKVSMLLLLLSRFGRVRLCATPWTAAHQAPPSLGFSRQEHWSGLPFPSPVHESEKWKWSRSVMSNSSRPHGLHRTRKVKYRRGKKELYFFVLYCFIFYLFKPSLYVINLRYITWFFQSVNKMSCKQWRFIWTESFVWMRWKSCRFLAAL